MASRGSTGSRRSRNMFPIFMSGTWGRAKDREVRSGQRFKRICLCRAQYGVKSGW